MKLYLYTEAIFIIGGFITLGFHYYIGGLLLTIGILMLVVDITLHSIIERRRPK